MNYVPESVTPESLGISSKAILEFLKRAKEQSIELHAVNVVRHDKRCLNICYTPYTNEMPQIMFSFSKSLTSTAIGFLEQEGLLTTDEKLIDIFPEFAPESPSENLKKCDVFSLLTMTCGHKDEIRDYADDPEWIRKFMANEFVYAPGTSYMYNTAGTNVLAAIVRKKSGLRMTDYLTPRFFEPLGIPVPHMVTLADGNDLGGAGYYLSPDDQLKFGRFLLARGAWEGKQLLRSEWFDRAATRQVSTVSESYDNPSPDWSLGYGFQYWMCQPENVFRADGAYGQFAVIMPDQDAFVTITSTSLDSQRILNILWDTVVASMRDEAYPEDPEAQSELRDTVKNAALAPLYGLRPYSLEEEIRQVNYAAPKNMPSLKTLIGGAGSLFRDEAVLRSIALSFGAGTVTLTAEGSDGTHSVTASLAGDFHREEIYGLPFASTAAWIGENTLLLEVRHLNATGGAFLCLKFNGDRLLLDRRATIPASRGLFDVPNEGYTFERA